MKGLEDTIAAISTPIGMGGLGIVRMSGKDALRIAASVFEPKNKTKNLFYLKGFTAHLGYIKDEEGNIIDEVLLILMRAPHSYTCEDVVEFSCHGGPVVLKQILQLCLKNGARLAEPGEFTKRAFLNGRIDLSQAEAVCDLINAKTTLQSKLFSRSLLGKTTQAIKNILNDIKQTIAMINVLIEYPYEEDVKNISEEEVFSRIKNLKKEITYTIENSEKITPFLVGFNIAIVGKVNVGKSSLLNVLLNYERAIVSDLPGTTRDTISETINISDVPVKIVDTAGIRQHIQNPIEKLGIERTKKAIEEADVVIFLFDASCEITQDDLLVSSAIKDVSDKKKIVIPVINKMDKEYKIFSEKEKFLSLIEELKDFVKIYPEIDLKRDLKEQLIFISCKTNQGIERLLKTILDSKNAGEIDMFEQEILPNAFVTNIRQIELLKKSLKELEEASKKDFKDAEIIVEHLNEACRYLSNIIGGEITEDVLNIIFERFCVGK